MNKIILSLLGLSLLLSASRGFAKVEDFQDLIVESTTAKNTLSKSLKNTVDRVDRPSTETGVASARPAHTMTDDQTEVENIVVPSAGLDVATTPRKNIAKQAARETEEQQKARVSSEINDDNN